MKFTKVAEIRQTKDYELFKLDPLNRSVTQVKKLQESMNSYGFLDAYPIHVVAVNGHFVIKDGQHRFESARSLDIPIKFVVCNSDKQLSIPGINGAQRAWSLRDYIASFKQQGIEDYATLMAFSETSRLSMGTSAALLCNNLPDNGTGNILDQIKSGKFKVKTLQFANDVSNVVAATASFVPWAKNAFWVAAVARVLRVKGVTVTTLIEKIKANPGMLHLMPTIDAFMQLIEDIYNYRCRAERIPIKFLAIEESRKRSAARK